MRKFLLPNEAQQKKMKCALNAAGVLKIFVPKLTKAEGAVDESSKFESRLKGFRCCFVFKV